MLFGEWLYCRLRDTWNFALRLSWKTKHTSFVSTENSFWKISWNFENFMVWTKEWRQNFPPSILPARSQNSRWYFILCYPIFVTMDILHSWMGSYFSLNIHHYVIWICLGPDWHASEQGLRCGQEDLHHQAAKAGGQTGSHHWIWSSNSLNQVRLCAFSVIFVRICFVLYSISQKKFYL